MSKFINPALVVAQTGLSRGMTAADLGCGSGFYVIPAAQLVGPTGTVYAVDVVDAKLEATSSIAAQMGYKNVRIIKADLAKPLLDIAENSVDLAIIGNILHEMDPHTRGELIKNAYRIVSNQSGLLVIEWKKQPTPFGPPLKQRIDQQQLEIMLMTAGFKKHATLEADGYHYAVLFEK